jgi:hypothetical protein
MRADGTLPDDPLVHVCAVAFASDMTLLDSTLLAHGLAWGTGDVIGASLDHAMWFHRPVPRGRVVALRPGVAVDRAARGCPAAASTPATAPRGQRRAGGAAPHAPLIGDTT